MHEKDLRGCRLITSWAAALLILSACGSTPTTDLGRLYGTQLGNREQPPVVLIHGALGGRLSNSVNGKEVWPGSLAKIIFSDYADLKLDIDPQSLTPRDSTLVADGIAVQAGGVDYYGRILQTLQNAGGYVPGVPGTSALPGERRYYVFHYDWRQDNVASARQLDAFIEQIRDDYMQPSLKVDVIAHSMGGLIARYYIRYGTADVLDDNNFPVTQYGADRIRRVVLLGTPNLGSIGAFRTLIRGYKIGLGTIPPEVVATFPSTYQVLPHAITSWFVTIDGRPLNRDQFDAENLWKRFEYSVFSPEVQARVRRSFGNETEAEAYISLLQRYFRKHIERARRFSWSLTVPVPDERIHYIVMGGDCIPTPARVVVEEHAGDSVLRLSPGEIRSPLPDIDYNRLMLEPGDGTVTKASLLARQTTDPTVARHAYSNFPVDYPIFLCERHSQLTGNLDFQNNLLHALLSVDR
ncbi:MAG: alpha/beta fold hydrolase [Woeseiaceae bacterium]|nr:alpha/beta fold hydrolase [Woeseiaceae bacterium]